MVRHYFGIKFDEKDQQWKIATALNPKRKQIVDCIKEMQRQQPDSKWTMGSCNL